MPGVNPEILVWARETAGLTQEEAARRNQSLRDTQNASAVDRLNALEYGLDEPSRSVLVEMARVYHRPLLTFYLPDPPAKGDRGADFRTLPADHTDADDALLDALLRDVRARQRMVRSVLEELEEARPLTFIGSHSMESGPAAVLATLKALLSVDLSDFRSQQNPMAAFGLLRTGAENAGVFVLLMGNLGTHHTSIDTDIFRGFTIADGIAPFVIINPNDARPALSFTLLHEIVHLLLGQTGVGSAHTDNDIERFCDDVAGEFLLPAEELNRLILDDKDDLGAVSERIGLFANQSNLSRTMVAYRAYRRDLISSEIYRRLSSIYREQWLEERENLRAQARSNAGGPSYYIVRRYGLSPSLVDLARRAISSGDLTTSKAAKVLGVKPSQVAPLFDVGRAS